MRATDQLSAMEMMAVDPIRRVVVPRFLGGVIAMPLLAAIFSVIGIYGAQLVGVQIMGVDSGSFWSQMRSAVGLTDVTEGIARAWHRRRLQPHCRLTKDITRHPLRRASEEPRRAPSSRRPW